MLFSEKNLYPWYEKPVGFLFCSAVLYPCCSTGWSSSRLGTFRLCLQWIANALWANWGMPSKTYSLLCFVKGSCHPWLGKIPVIPCVYSQWQLDAAFLMSCLRLPHSAVTPCKPVFVVFHRVRALSLPSLLSASLQCNKGLP